jgi:hypothetical protein
MPIGPDMNVPPVAPDVQAAAPVAQGVGRRTERRPLDPASAIPALHAPESLHVTDLAVVALDVPAVVVERLELETIAIDDLSEVPESKEHP